MAKLGMWLATLAALLVLAGRSVQAVTYHATPASLGLGNGLSPVNGIQLQLALPLLSAGDTLIVYQGTHLLLPQTNVLPANVQIIGSAAGTIPRIRTSAHISGLCQTQEAILKVNGSTATVISNLDFQSRHVGTTIAISQSTGVILSDLKLGKFCRTALLVQSGSSIRFTGSTIDGEGSFPTEQTATLAGGLVMYQRNQPDSLLDAACSAVGFVANKDGDTTLSNVLVEDSTIEGVVTQGQGAAIVQRGTGSSGCRLRISGSTIADNRAGNAPAVYLEDQAILEAQATVFRGNTGTGSAPSSSATVRSTAMQAQLGSSCAHDEWIQAVTGAFAAANQATLGLAPLGADDILRLTVPHVRLENCTLADGAVAAPGGADPYAPEADGPALRVLQVCLTRDNVAAHSVYVRDSWFVNNRGLRAGAGMQLDNVPVDVRDTQFLGNSLQQPDDPSTGGGGGGGGGSGPEAETVQTLESLDALGGAAIFITGEVEASGPGSAPECTACAVVVRDCTFRGQEVQAADSAEETPSATDIHLRSLKAAAVLQGCVFGASSAPARSSRYASVGTSGDTSGSLVLQDVEFTGEQAGPGLLVGGSHDAQVQLTQVRSAQTEAGTRCPAVVDVATESSSGSSDGPSLSGSSISISDHAVVLDDCTITGAAEGVTGIAPLSAGLPSPGNASLFQGISLQLNDTCGLARGCALDLRPAASGSSITISDSTISGFRCVNLPAVHALGSEVTVTIQETTFSNIASIAANGTSGSDGRVHGGAIGLGPTAGLLPAKKEDQMSSSYSFLLVDSIFSNCHAISGAGGGVFLSSQPLDMAVVGTTFERCSSAEVGGGMALFAAPAGGYASSSSSQSPPSGPESSSDEFRLNTPLDVASDLASSYAVLRLPGTQSHERNVFRQNAAALGGGGIFQMASGQPMHWSSTDFYNNSVVPASRDGAWPLPAADSVGLPASDGASASGDFSVGYIGGGHVAVAMEQGDDSTSTTSLLQSALGQLSEGCSISTSGTNDGSGVAAVKFSDVRFVGGSAPHGGAVVVLQGDPIALVEETAGGLALNTSLERGALVGGVNFSQCLFASNVAGGAVSSAGGAVLIEGRADTAVLAATSSDVTVFRECDFAGNRVIVPPASSSSGIATAFAAAEALASSLASDGAVAVLAGSASVAATGLGSGSAQAAADGTDARLIAEQGAAQWLSGGIDALMDFQAAARVAYYEVPFDTVGDASGAGSDLFVTSSDSGFPELLEHEAESLVAADGVLEGASLLRALPIASVARLATHGADVCSPSLGASAQQSAGWRGVSPALADLEDLAGTGYTAVAAHIIGCREHKPASVAPAWPPSLGASLTAVGNISGASRIVRPGKTAGAFGTSAFTTRAGRIFVGGGLGWNEAQTGGSPLGPQISDGFRAGNGSQSPSAGALPFPHAFNSSGDWLNAVAQLSPPTAQHMTGTSRPVRVVSADPIVGIDAPADSTAASPDVQCGYPEGEIHVSALIANATAVVSRPRPFLSIRAAVMAAPRDIRLALLPGLHTVQLTAQHNSSTSSDVASDSASNGTAADDSFLASVSAAGRLVADGTHLFDSDGSNAGQTVFLHVQDQHVSIEHAGRVVALPSGVAAASYLGPLARAVPGADSPWTSGALDQVFVPLPAEYQLHNAPAVNGTVEAAGTNVSIRAGLGCTIGESLQAGGENLTAAQAGLQPRGVSAAILALLARSSQSINPPTSTSLAALAARLSADTSKALPQVVLQNPSVTSCLPLGSAAALGLEGLSHVAQWWPSGALRLQGHPEVVRLGRQLLGRAAFDEMPADALALLAQLPDFQEPNSTAMVLSEFDALARRQRASPDLGPEVLRAALAGNVTESLLLGALGVCVDARSAPRLFDVHARVMALVHGGNGTEDSAAAAIADSVQSAPVHVGVGQRCGGGDAERDRNVQRWVGRMDQFVAAVGIDHVVVDPAGTSSLLGVMVQSSAGSHPSAISRAVGHAYDSLCDIRVFGVSAVAQQCVARPIPAADSSFDAHQMDSMLPDAVARVGNSSLSPPIFDDADAKQAAQFAVDAAQRLNLLPEGVEAEVLAAGLHDATLAGAGLRPSRSLASIRAVGMLLAPHVPVIAVRGSGAFAEVRAGQLSLEGIVILREPVVDEAILLRQRYAGVLAEGLALATGINATEHGNFTAAVASGLLPVFVPDETRLVKLLSSLGGGDTFWTDQIVDPIDASNGVFSGGLVAMPSGHGTYVGDLGARSRVVLRGSGVFGFLAQTLGGAISVECNMCEVVVDRTVAALNGVRGSPGWLDSDSDGEFELDTSVFNSGDSAPAATVGGGFLAVTGAAATASVWRSLLSHNSALLANGGAIMIGDAAQGRAHIHETIIHACDAYWGGGIAATGFGSFLTSLSSVLRRTQGGSSGTGSNAKLGLAYAILVDADFAGYEEVKGADVEFVPIAIKSFKSDRSVQEAAYAHVASKGFPLILPPFGVSLGGDSGTGSAAVSGSSLSMLHGSRVIGCTGVKGGGVAVGGTASTSGPLPSFASSSGASFDTDMGQASLEAYTAMYRIALGNGQTGDLASIAGRSYSGGVLSGIDKLHFRATDTFLQGVALLMNQAVPDTTLRDTLGKGGGLYSDGVLSLLTSAVILADNIAEQSGGCLDLVDTHALLGEGTSMVRCTSAGVGGALSHEYTREEQDSSLMMQGAAITYSGARTRGGGAYVNVVQQFLTDSVVHGCHAGLHGGGMYLDDDARIKSMSDFELESNAAGQFGGGMFASSFSEVSATDTEFVCNEANTDAVVSKPDGEASLSVSDGGGIAAEESSQVLFRKVTFRSNAAVRGGAAHLADPLSIDTTVRADDVVEDTEAGTGIFKGCKFQANRGLQGAAIYTATFSTALSDEALLREDNKFNTTLSPGQAAAAGPAWSPGDAMANAITLPVAVAGAAAQAGSCYPLNLLSHETISAASLTAKADIHGVPDSITASSGPQVEVIGRIVEVLGGEALTDRWDSTETGARRGRTAPVLAWNIPDSSPLALAVSNGTLHAVSGTTAPLQALGQLRLGDTNGSLAPPAVLWSLQALACATAPEEDLDCVGPDATGGQAWVRPLLEADTLDAHIAGQQVSQEELEALAARPFPWTFFEDSQVVEGHGELSGTPPVALGWRGSPPESVPSGTFLSDSVHSTGVGIVLLDRLGQSVRWTTPTVQLQASIETAPTDTDLSTRGVTLRGSASFFIPATGEVDMDVGALGEPQRMALKVRSQGFRPSMTLPDAPFELRSCEPGWGPVLLSSSGNESTLYAFASNASTDGASLDDIMCSQCPTGHASLDGLECQLCPGGSVAKAEGSLRCTTCTPVGQFWTDGDRENCITCEDSSVPNSIPSPDLTSCEECPPGTLATGGSCIPCQIGEYQVDDACLPCEEPTQYTNQTGQAQCQSVPLGHTAVTSGDKNIGITPCPAGTFESGRLCVSCSEAEVTLLAGQTSCQSCPEGSVPDQTTRSTCIPCARGTESNGIECTPCNTGHANGNVGGNCTQCDPGYFAASSGASECLPCPGGTYAPSYATSSCTSCPANFFSLEGSSECVSCLENTDCSAGVLVIPTSGVWFRDESASFQVQNETGAQIDVFLQSTSNVISRSRRMQTDNDSQAAANETDPARMLLDPATPVIECPVPEACVIDEVIVPRRLANRFLGSSSTEASARRLRARQAAAQFSGRLLQTSNSSVIDLDEETTTLYFSRCADGHEGPLCAVCKPGWAEKSRGAVCVKCEQGESVVRGLGIFGLSVAVVLFLMHSLRSALNESLRTVKVHLESAVLRVQTKERRLRRRSVAIEAIQQLVGGSTPTGPTATPGSAPRDQIGAIMSDSAGKGQSNDGSAASPQLAGGSRQQASSPEVQQAPTNVNTPSRSGTIGGAAIAHDHLHAVLEANQREAQEGGAEDPDSDANPKKFSRVALIRIIMTYLQTNAVLGGLSLKGPEVYEQIIGAASTPATGAPDQLTFVNCTFEWSFIVKLVAYALLPIVALFVVLAAAGTFLAVLWHFDPEEEGYKGQITEDLAEAGEATRPYDDSCRQALTAAIQGGLVDEESEEREQGVRQAQAEASAGGVPAATAVPFSSGPGSKASAADESQPLGAASSGDRNPETPMGDTSTISPGRKSAVAPSPLLAGGSLGAEAKKVQIVVDAKAVFRSHFDRAFARGVAMLIVLLFILYPSITGYTLAAFRSYSSPVEGHSYLSSDFTISLDSDTYLGLVLPVALASLLLYVIGLPGCASLALRANRHHMNRPSFLMQTSFLYAGMKHEYFFWEVNITVARKVALSAIMSLMSDPFLQMYCAIYVMLAALQLQQLVQPFQHRLLNRAETVALTVTALSQAGSLLYWQYRAVDIPLTVVLLFMHGCAFVFLISMVFETSRPWADWFCFGVCEVGPSDEPQAGSPSGKQAGMRAAKVIPVDADVLSKSGTAMERAAAEAGDLQELPSLSSATEAGRVVHQTATDSRGIGKVEDSMGKDAP